MRNLLVSLFGICTLSAQTPDPLVAVDYEAQQQWVDHVREVADSTLYPLANSWYMGANIPGKARVFMPYVAGVEAYTKECNRVTQNGYQGFEFSTNIS